MAEKIIPDLKNVAETLLIPLYVRAIEAQRPDALVRDKKAAEIVQMLDCDFSHHKLHGHDEVAVLMRVRHFDLLVREFLAENPEAVVVHFGCGLDTRFDRLDNGHAEWFDLDLPEVINLRKMLIGGDTARYHLLAGSAFDNDWLEAVDKYHGKPFFFLAEGVLPYFKIEQVKTLVQTLHRCFPGAELAFDAHTPFVIKMDNLQLMLSKVAARLQWGLKQGKDVEDWGEGIELLDEYYYFEESEPRMRPYRWMGKIPLLGKSTGIFHYRLG